MVDIRGVAKIEIIRLEGIKKRIEKFLANAPEGSLKCQLRDGKTYYYRQLVNNMMVGSDNKESMQATNKANNQATNKANNQATNKANNQATSKADNQAINKQNFRHIKREYIRRKDISLAKALAQKYYYMAVYPIVEKNIQELKLFVKSYNQEELEKAYSSLSIPRKQLVTPIQQSVEEAYVEWQSESYEKNDIYPENLRYETDQGELVRSKSEVIIANFLYKYRKDISYKYERPLQIIVNGVVKTIYPDFTIFNLHTGNITYWEHAGRMEDSYYANDFVKKMNLYVANGLIPGKDVILTFETQSNPIDISVVKKIIKEII